MNAMFTRLIDDAALFPPAEEPMHIAVSGHHDRSMGRHGWVLGRFLCTGSRLAELQQSLDTDERMELGLILADRADAMIAMEVADDDLHFDLTAVELGPRFGDPTHLTETVTIPVYCEVDRDSGLDDQLDRIAAARAEAKLRTGGVVAEAFPPVDEVAAFITACVQRGIGFKCTAGLHNAIAHRDPDTGFDHFGFLNIILATHAAHTDTEVADALRMRDPARVKKEIVAISETDTDLVRESFHGFGSCSFSDPLDDLIGLGLVAEDRGP